MRYALLALLLALPFATGCRDALVDPGPTPAAPPGEAPGTIYLKGPSELPLETAAVYRGGPMADVEYRWLFNSQGFESPPEWRSGRIIQLRAVSPGLYTIQVSAMRDGQLIAQGEREVLVY